MIPVIDALVLALFAYPLVAFVLERTGVIAAVPRPYHTGLMERVTGEKSIAGGSEQSVKHPAD